jgi:hypothetical protein
MDGHLADAHRDGGFGDGVGELFVFVLHHRLPPGPLVIRQRPFLLPVPRRVD